MDNKEFDIELRVRELASIARDGWPDVNLWE